MNLPIRSSSLRGMLDFTITRRRFGRRRQQLATGALRQACIMEPLEERQLLNGYVVTNSNDSGAGSLRDAILYANSRSGLDVITFSISGNAVIRPLTALPAITDEVTIDGKTQPGYSGTPLVTLDGFSCAGTEGLTLAASNSSILGLSLVNWYGAAISITSGGGNSISYNSIQGGRVGISVEGAGANTIQSNRIDSTYGDGILVVSDHNTIGGYWAGNTITAGFSNAIEVRGSGTIVQYNHIEGNNLGIWITGANTSIQDNVIPGNWGDAIQFDHASGSNVVSGNLIGLDENGMTWANGGNTNGVTVKGSAATPTATFNIEGNTIAGNWGDGVYVEDSSGVVIVGNTIGQNQAGASMPNSGNGVYILGSSVGNAVGGAGQGAGNIIRGSADGVKLETAEASGNVVEGNTIFESGSYGVWVLSGTGNKIAQNSIYACGDLGINLGMDGVTLNDTTEHKGPNLDQNFPVISSAEFSSGTLKVSGTLAVGKANANKSYTIEVFVSAEANKSLYGEGQSYVGSLRVAADSFGNASFAGVFAGVPDQQGVVTATATDSLGNTSEFSKAYSATLVQQAATNTTLTCNPATSLYGDTVTFTATVAPVGATGVPTGTVRFMEGATLLGAGQLADGVASFSTSSLSLGDHLVTAVYDGDADYQASTSNAVDELVKASTVTSVWSSGNPTAYGQAITFFAHVATTFGAPGGAVLFWQDNTLLGSVAMEASGTVLLTASGFQPGSYNIQAVYSGDLVHASSSGTMTQQVSRVSTAMGVDAATGTYGATTSLTARLTSRGLAMSGRTVTFKVHGATAGQAVTDGNGVATLSGVSLLDINAGSYTADVEASFDGDATFAPAVASSDLTVGKAAQVITWADPAAIVYGTPLGADQLNATVAGIQGGSMPGALSYSPAAGTVLDAGDGQALSVSAAETDNYYAAIATVHINVAPAVLSVTVNDAGKVYGEDNPAFSASYSGFVAGDDASVLGGALVFTTPAGKYSDVGSYPVSASGLAAGSYQIQYVSGTLVISQAATSVVLTSSAGATLDGQVVSFTAKVSAAAGSGVPTGAVTFMDGSTVLGIATLNNGVATFAAPLAAGTHSITAVYAGDANFQASSSDPLNQQVFVPASLSGYVYFDKNGNGAMDACDPGIADVLLTLTDSAGNPVATAITDINGAYAFSNLLPGVYTIAESQPAGYLDGDEAAGTLGGLVAGAPSDVISGVNVADGQNGTDYNFGELRDVAANRGHATKPTKKVYFSSKKVRDSGKPWQ